MVYLCRVDNIHLLLLERAAPVLVTLARFFMLKNVVLNDTIQMLPPLYWYGKGVCILDILAAFIVTVAGGVVCHYIIKWLDRDK